jgi:hypothetical protein
MRDREYYQWRKMTLAEDKGLIAGHETGALIFLLACLD